VGPADAPGGPQEPGEPEGPPEPAAAPAAGGPEHPADGDGDADGIASIRSAWPSIVSAIGSNPANRPLVTTCRPVELRDGFLVLGFPEDQAFMRDIAERKRRVLEEGISGVVGRSVAVRCVVTNLELVEPVGTGEGDLVAKARHIFDGDLAAVEDID
jgi:hypothetical protein